jgi:hypothetical protein
VGRKAASRIVIVLSSALAAFPVCKLP